MKRRLRIYYSDTQKALMWASWKQGLTPHEIGKLSTRPLVYPPKNRLDRWLRGRGGCR